jgi:hypothetical protein
MTKKFIIALDTFFIFYFVFFLKKKKVKVGQKFKVRSITFSYRIMLKLHY